MKVSKDFLFDMLDYHVGEVSDDGWKVIESRTVSTDRWNVHKQRVYLCVETGEYWGTFYSVGATEYQDTQPYDDDPEEIELTPMIPIQVTKWVKA